MCEAVAMLKQFATRGPVLPSSKRHRRAEAAVHWDSQLGEAEALTWGDAAE